MTHLLQFGNWAVVRLTFLATALFLFLLPVTQAQSLQPVARYLDQSTSADNQTMWPLLKLVTVNFNSCTDIECAIHKVTRIAGYEIYPNDLPMSVFNTFNKTIPRAHKSFIDLTIIEVVHALMGPAFRILVDPYDRYIAFKPEGVEFHTSSIIVQPIPQ